VYSSLQGNVGLRYRLASSTAVEHTLQCSCPELSKEGSNRFCAINAVQTSTLKGVGGSSLVAGYNRILTPLDTLDVNFLMGELWTANFLLLSSTLHLGITNTTTRPSKYFLILITANPLWPSSILRSPKPSHTQHHDSQ
jgi:hypothetical protein